MVTDEQYKDLLKRVETLEKRYSTWFSIIATLDLNNDPPRVERLGASKTKAIMPRDRTKYKFFGKIYCKRQLVLEVIKRYVNDHRPTKQELSAVFPDRLQGALGVIQLASVADHYKGAKKRFFFADTDRIILEDDCYVVCSQWEAKNIAQFITEAKKYYNIEEIKY